MIVHIEEIIGVRKKQPKPQAKTDWEKNQTRIKSKERKLDAVKPVKPVSPD
jgi:hypothetical protein